MLIFSSSAARLAEALAFASANHYDCHPDILTADELGAASASGHSLALEFSESVVQLRSLCQPKLSPLSVDFVGGKAGFRQHKARTAGGVVHEQILKAMGLHRHSGNALDIVDATAGLGRDAYIVAGQVRRVMMFERHPVLARLLQDGLDRAQTACMSQHTVDIVGRMQLCAGDFTSWTVDPGLQVDIVYLDPMFAGEAGTLPGARNSRKSGAMVKKDMQLLHQLHAAELADSSTRVMNERRLFDKAMSLNPARIVVKRARHAPVLAGEQTDLQLEGKAGRFDIYALRSLKKAQVPQLPV